MRTTTTVATPQQQKNELYMNDMSFVGFPSICG